MLNTPDRVVIAATPMRAAQPWRHVLAQAAAALACCAGLIAHAQAQSDPPGRVGRLSLLDGHVALRAGAADATAARLNWPVTSGDVVETSPAAHAEVRIGSTAVWMDGDSVLRFERIDDRGIGLRLDRGSAALRVRDAQAAGSVSMATAQGRVEVSQAALLRIDTGRASQTTTLALFDGSARFAGADGSTTLLLQPGREVQVSGGAALSISAGAVQRDAFDTWVAASEANAQSPRNGYVSAEMTGADALDAYGGWDTTVEYGPVWYPRSVDAEWVPYRDGSWISVAPWGWTWVDDAPWGFAPFHYGRWAWIGGRWGWAPGVFEPRPVYAPALVGWIGAPGWRFSVSVGESIGWFPLAPFEPFYPGYRVGIDYVRRINVANVRDVRSIVNVTQSAHIDYANRSNVHAVTVVPRSVLGERRSIAAAALPLHDARQLASLPATLAQPPRQPAWRSAAMPPADSALRAAPTPIERRAEPAQRFEAPREPQREEFLREPQRAQREPGGPERGGERAERRPEERHGR